MTEPTLTTRVEIVEEKVQSLDGLPARVAAVELQIVQLRDEMRGEFSAVRQELQALGADLRGEIKSVDNTLRAEIRALEHAVRAEIQAGDEETRRQMRVLHEDLVARIKTSGGA